eukprot:SAG31_NODE_29231_length_398_cov_4.026756_1_plen_64_part_10
MGAIRETYPPMSSRDSPIRNVGFRLRSKNGYIETGAVTLRFFRNSDFRGYLVFFGSSHRMGGIR